MDVNMENWSYDTWDSETWEQVNTYESNALLELEVQRKRSGDEEQRTEMEQEMGRVKRMKTHDDAWMWEGSDEWMWDPNNDAWMQETINNDARTQENSNDAWMRDPNNDVWMGEGSSKGTEAQENSNDAWMWDPNNDVWMGEGSSKGTEETGNQTGFGEEHNEEMSSGEESDEDFYVMENVKQVRSKKFKTSAMTYAVRFNDTYKDLDLIEEYERAQGVFTKLLDDVTRGMKENDQVRFVLRSTQLDTPISIPFMHVSRLTPERVFSQIERVVQSNQDFRLNETVFVDITHVEMPEGSGYKKRKTISLEEFMHNKKTFITIQNKDDLCLARALVVAIAKIEKDVKYKSLVNRKGTYQERMAKELHKNAGVPLGPCGIPEVKRFQTYLTQYEINIVSMEHSNAIIHPEYPTDQDGIKRIYIYLHHGHYDVITTMMGFFGKSYYCHSCRKPYNLALDHLCPAMCKLCRAFDCNYDSQPQECSLCNRLFKSKECYERHKEPVGKGRSVCEGIKKCPYCKKSVKVNTLDPKNHLCIGVKCKTCGEKIDQREEHQCYMRREHSGNNVKHSGNNAEDDVEDDVEDDAEDDAEDNTENEQVCVTKEEYNELLFFDYECRQEDGIHKPNLCIVHNEVGDEWLFQGEDTNSEFCHWLFTEEHRDCIAIAHNFQGYDGYFIQNFLNGNSVKYSIIMNGAKILSLTVPMFNIKFIDSLNFIPMSLAKFPETFGMDELCKGYFPHLFNRRENANYVGPIPCENHYGPNTMTTEKREAFRIWHKEQRDSNYVFNFNEEIIKYCRSDVDILRCCCMSFREMFRDVTGIDPFGKCLTIASACQLVYCTNFLKENTIGIFNSYRQMGMNQSNTALKWLSFVAEKEDIFIEHGKNGGEKSVGRYHLDGYHSETNTAYEFQGCYWHGCLSCYARNTINSKSMKTMHQLRQETMKKVWYLRGQGLRVVEMWGCDLEKELEQNEDMNRYFEEYDLVDPLQPRDAFYGGRTNASKLFHECKDGEEIGYDDFTSLYPWCNKMTKTIVGHPEIITENFDDISSYFGLIKCTVLPPRGLLHPVLPYRTQGKLMFPLCKTCADTLNQNPCTHSEHERSILGTWCHVELLKALEKGYQILKLHEVWHFPTQSDELFKEYVNTFLKIKQEASGYPKGCVTEEQKQTYVDAYFEHEGIQLDRENIGYNSGMRALAKLMLNSFWGKFAQRTNATKTEVIMKPQHYFDLLTSEEIEVCNVQIISDTALEVQYRNTSEFIEPNNKTNVVIAAYTTAYARLKLYDLLDTLQERVLYYDTDSVIYVREPGKPNLPHGNYLGELTDELKGDSITTFVSGGPKNYAYRTKGGKSETKVRGITLNHSTSKKINPDTIRALVHLHTNCEVDAKITTVTPFKITRDKRKKNIVSKEMKKDYRIVYNKRVITKNYETIPYGY